MEIKAHDLMLGDWIYIVTDAKKIRGEFVVTQVATHRVTGIMSDTDNPSIQTDATDTYYGEESYRPIKITDKILERNGFRKYSDCEFVIIEPDIIWYKNGLYIYNENKVLYDEIDCYYVHQLQHLLKLIGSDKEIVV